MTESMLRDFPSRRLPKSLIGMTNCSLFSDLEVLTFAFCSGELFVVLAIWTFHGKEFMMGSVSTGFA